MHAWVIQDNIVLRETDHEPIYQSQKLWMQSLLGDYKVDIFNIYLSRVEWYAYDSWLGMGMAKSGSFYQVSSIASRPQI